MNNKLTAVVVHAADLEEEGEVQEFRSFDEFRQYVENNYPLVLSPCEDGRADLDILLKY